MKGIMTEKEMRELNCWIAEHVFGGVWYRFKDLEYLKRSDPDDGAFIVIGIDLKHFKSNKDYCPDTGELPHKGFSWIPKYTTDPAAAMMVLEKCAEKISGQDYPRGQGTYFIRVYQASTVKEWCVTRGNDHVGNPPYGQSKTLPLAIANFAKKLFEPK